MNINNDRSDFNSKKSYTDTLRRADFRFLLSDPKPSQTICLADGLLANGVELISESVLYSTPKDSEDFCDLFVVVEPDQKTLSQAFRALKPGGDIYIEWSVPRLVNISSIKKSLSKIGFENIDTYLPKPDLSHDVPFIWIPIGAPGAIEFIINSSNQSLTKSLFMRAAYSIRRISWLMFPNLFLTYPLLLNSSLKKFSLCSIARKPLDQSMVYNTNRALSEGIVSKDTARANYLDELKDSWTDWGLGNCPEKLHTLMLTKGMREDNKVALIVFPDESHKPSLVVKSTRNNEVAEGLEHETNILCSLQENYESIEGIPKVLYSERNSDFYTVVESFISGIELYSILRANNFRAFALQVTTLLIELAKKTKSEPPKQWRDLFVDQLITDLVSIHSSVLNTELIEKTKAILGNIQIPFLICEHRDLSPKHVYVDSDQKLGIIDWENSKLIGFPAIDLTYFLTRLSSFLDDANSSMTPQESYRNMLDSSTPNGSVYKECLNYYNKELNIPFSSIAPLRLMTWIIHLHTRYVINGPYDSQTFESDLFFDFWKEELKLKGDS